MAVYSRMLLLIPNRLCVFSIPAIRGTTLARKTPPSASLRKFFPRGWRDAWWFGRPD